jgi:HEAT repeat protein
MRFAGLLAVIALIGFVATADHLGAQTKDTKDPKDAKDPLKDIKKDKEDAPSYINGKTLHEWTLALKHADPSVRQQAIQNVVAFGPVARMAIPTLTTYSLRELDASLRGDAAAAIGMIAAMDKAIDAEEAPKVVQALTVLLGTTETQRSVRLQATLAIAQFGPRGRIAIPMLVDNARDSYSWHLRKAVCFALGRVGNDPAKGPDTKALTTLVGSLKDIANPVRFEAILALSAMGMSPRPAEVDMERKALEALLVDHDKNIAIWARVLLCYIDPKYLEPKSLTQLTTFLQKDNDPKVRSSAARAIGTLGSKAKTLVPNLYNALGDKDLDVILSTLSALGMMVGEVPTVLPELESRLTDSEAAVRGHVAGVLGHLGKHAKSSIPKLTAALRDKDSTVVYQVIVALMRLGAMSESSATTLDELAKNHKDEYIKRASEEGAKYIREQADKAAKEPAKKP